MSLPVLTSGRADHRRDRAEIHLARQEIDQRRAGAAIRNLRHLHAQLLEDQHLGQMTERADAGMADLDAAPRLFHPRQQFLEIVRRQRRPPASVLAAVLMRPIGDEILFRVEREIRIKRHARRQRVLVQQDCVAIRRGAGGLGGGDHAAGTADIFDHDRLAQRFLAWRPG